MVTGSNPNPTGWKRTEKNQTDNLPKNLTKQTARNEGMTKQPMPNTNFNDNRAA